VGQTQNDGHTNADIQTPLLQKKKIASSPAKADTMAAGKQVHGDER